MTLLAFIGALWVLTFAFKVAQVLWVRHHRRQRDEEFLAALCEAVGRHPAGSAMYAFRARPCGHLLRSVSPDTIDLEHVEFDHVLLCPVAEAMIANRRDAA